MIITTAGYVVSPVQQDTPVRQVNALLHSLNARRDNNHAVMSVSIQQPIPQIADTAEQNVLPARSAHRARVLYQLRHPIQAAMDVYLALRIAGGPAWT